MFIRWIVHFVKIAVAFQLDGITSNLRYEVVSCNRSADAEHNKPIPPSMDDEEDFDAE
jgi:hypothetical protein